MTALLELLEDHTTPYPAEVGRSATTPGVALSFDCDGVRETYVAGYRTLLPMIEPATEDTTWDLASLTKLYTATLTAIAVERGLVAWDTPLKELMEWRGDINASVLDLVEHVSGLPAWERFYDDLPLNPSPEQAAAARTSIRAAILEREPSLRGKHRYSDLGYLLLGFLLEEWFDAPLEETLQSEICAPLGLKHTAYAVARPSAFRDAAATEWCSRRGRWVRGTVHDENCDVVGGVAGHAGIFATVGDVVDFGVAMLEIFGGRDGIIRTETLRELWRGRALSGNHFGGWDTPSGPASSAGSGFPADTTFGHLGFTGTSIWLETTTNTVAVLLTNRVHPSRENARIKEFRIAVHDALWRDLHGS
jgi:CubicO group peptidase (beta-lactamase class C family)